VKDQSEKEDTDCLQPKPPHHWFWGHLKLLGDAIASLPPDCHYHTFMTTIAHKYNMTGVFYIDLWPIASSHLVVVDPDVAQYMYETFKHQVDEPLRCESYQQHI
jgi:hypothetical protein